MAEEETPSEHLRCRWTRGKNWRCRRLKIHDFPYCEKHRDLLNIQISKHESSSLASRSVEVSSSMIQEKVYRRTKEQSNHLPFDLFSNQILPRLPVKSLVRFTSVCKTWESFIKSSKFIATHRKFNISKPEGQYALILDKKSCYVVENQEPIYLEKLSSISIYPVAIDCFPAESCNGLILLRVSVKISIDFLLWNPSIRKCKSVETSPFFKSIFDGSYPSFYNVCGLGFHDSSNDHRVIRIKYFRVKEKISARVEKYSLRTESWKKVIGSNPPDGLVAFRGGVFLNGSVHWLATRNVYFVDGEYCHPMEHSIESILVFNIENQCFAEMKLPEHFDYAGTRLVAFKEFQGSLAALFFDYNDNKCFLWVMTKYGVTNSWNKKLTISLPEKCGYPLGFTKNGLLVCEHCKQENTPSTSSRKKVPGFIFLEVENFGIDAAVVVDYKESLSLITHVKTED
ncbi:hypothetical protein ACJIZ3_010787 [Penstemon smallii]|uniref:WRC domain-containing protein n=1 Tax=Penstemon smallii TaxID=265156 RepID=A0ABD3UKV8_9LAMI